MVLAGSSSGLLAFLSKTLIMKSSKEMLEEMSKENQNYLGWVGFFLVAFTAIGILIYGATSG